MYGLLFFPLFLSATTVYNHICSSAMTMNGVNGHANGQANGHAEPAETGTFRVKAGLAKMLKGGVIMGKWRAASLHCQTSTSSS